MDKLLPLVSVIVPVYNGEIFLEKCLQSVICQSYTNIEIIVVNDGSIDNTSLIIDRYVKLDKRIIGLEQKNGGPALARNKGLKIAKGKYVQYLDSDDCLHEKAIEYLLDKAEASNADIVVAPFQFSYSAVSLFSCLTHAARPHLINRRFLISQVCLVLITLKKY